MGEGDVYRPKVDKGRGRIGRHGIEGRLKFLEERLDGDTVRGRDRGSSSADAQRR